MTNTRLHGSYNSQNTLLQQKVSDSRDHKIWDCESALYDSYELVAFAHIIERKLLPFSPSHVRPPRLNLRAVMDKDKEENSYASSKTTTGSSQRRKHWWNRKNNYEIKKEIKKRMLPSCFLCCTKS
ncbi:unnamed protein product [Eruca vesicaria subsp. sativa]|uniref:Uncharacterized protein n=1 Tax=Eruca vesicaria subsp. sativa TaxID=29727 RepID=A0ABC8LT62_ERUVS|nr:unnamed protein product [Eruca vesicaria subsp. sativa]